MSHDNRHDKGSPGPAPADKPADRPQRPTPEEELASYVMDPEAPDRPPTAAAAPSESLESLRLERDEYKDKYFRAQAELSNTIRRLSQQHGEALKHAGMDLARGLLPILDNFQRVLDTQKNAPKDDPIATGVKLIAEMLGKTLRDAGIEPIEAVGKPFDPRWHEAVMQDHDSRFPPGTVSRELERGYRMHDRVLRYARVAVSAAPAATPSAGQG